MYKILDISDTNKSNLSYVNIFKNQNINIILLTYNLTDTKFLRSINSHLINNLCKLEIEMVPPEELESELTEFFIEQNWQLFSKFLDKENYEFGTSVILIITISEDIFIVQFGRMLCGIIKENKLEYIGKSWDNFKIKTKKDLFLLGSRDEDINVKINKPLLDKNSLLFSIPSLEADKIASGITILNIKRKIRKLFKIQSFPYVILCSQEFTSRERESWINKLWKKLCK